MVSDAGGPLVHRRRREVAFPIYFLLSLLVSPMLSASFFSLQTVFHPLKTLYPFSFLNGNEKISDGARRWGPAFALSLHPQLAISLPKPSSPSDATLKTKSIIIAQPYSSRSYPISPEEHSHRTSLMAGELPLGPSDAPCPVEVSTAHGGSIFWAESLWFSDRTSSEIMLSLLTLSFGFTRSTPKTAPPRSILFTYPVTASISDLTPLAMSNRDSEQPINPLKRQQAPGKTLIPKWVSSFVRSPSVAGPLFFPPRPTKFSMGLTLATTWPRSCVRRAGVNQGQEHFINVTMPFLECDHSTISRNPRGIVFDSPFDRLWQATTLFLSPMYGLIVELPYLCYLPISYKSTNCYLCCIQPCG
ncbi:unnamed protein product [Arabidopsis halleri]